jgi:putative transposase
MPRASRYLLPGFNYHLTQRCHNRAFLLRFARDRSAYREWLRVGAKRYDAVIFGFTITCNHVHIVVHVDDLEKTSSLMHLAAGAGGQQYNRRKNKSGAFWEDTYHCTIIEDGSHLWNCLQYVDLNMVRAGVVRHPSEWKWCGYDELMGKRQRYRILSIDRLVESLRMGSIGDLRASYELSLAARINAGAGTREACWTDALAVGSKDFVCSVRTRYDTRSRFTLEQTSTGTEGDRWTVRETRAAYGAFLARERGCKPAEVSCPKRSALTGNM